MHATAASSPVKPALLVSKLFARPHGCALVQRARDLPVRPELAVSNPAVDQQFFIQSLRNRQHRVGPSGQLWNPIGIN